MLNKNNQALPQVEQKEKLRQQKDELEAYIQKPTFARLSPSQKNEALQKLTQIKEALASSSGELDPAFAQNKNYRKGSNYSQE